jgi:hypothetical protein
MKIDKNTKIKLTELTKNIEFISRAGDVFRFREKGIITREFDLDTDTLIKSPSKGLRVKNIDGVWFWLCDCPQCLGKDPSFAYSVCDKHDICITCGINRTKLKETPWGCREGWRCKPCETKRVKKAINDYKQTEPEQYSDTIICPHCGNKDDGSDLHESDNEYLCGNCSSPFEIEVEYSKYFSMSFISKKEK